MGSQWTELRAKSEKAGLTVLGSRKLCTGHSQLVFTHILVHAMSACEDIGTSAELRPLGQAIPAGTAVSPAECLPTGIG
jgi:hypothetical protein